MTRSPSHGRVDENVIYIVKHQGMDAAETGYKAEDATVTAVRPTSQAHSQAPHSTTRSAKRLTRAFIIHKRLRRCGYSTLAWRIVFRRRNGEQSNSGVTEKGGELGEDAEAYTYVPTDPYLNPEYQ